MKNTQIIRRPLITEKTTIAREKGEVIVFQVALDATKVDVRRAVEKLFNTQVASVRTQIQHGQFELMGIRHRELPIEGVQFHPESFLTQHGHQLLRNFLENRR